MSQYRLERDVEILKSRRIADGIDKGLKVGLESRQASNKLISRWRNSMDRVLTYGGVIFCP